MATQQVTPSWCKLKSGAWGVKGPGLKEGQQVTLTNSKGNSKSVTVGKVVWAGDGLVIATIVEEAEALLGVTTGAPTARHPMTKPYHGRPGWERFNGYGRRGECEDCAWNQDAGDMMGCPRHRGNPQG